MLRLLMALSALLVLASCNDTTQVRDLNPPAAPRGLTSVTGDHEVFLEWVANTEADVAGYHVYVAPCASGDDCPYERVGTTGLTRFTVTGLTNGTLQFFAVAAFDRDGNESRLSRADVFDTPRPEGRDLVLSNYADAPAASGYDFSGYAVRRYDDLETDVFFGTVSGVRRMFTPFEDTDIQDAGYATSLDHVDFAPAAGWSPTGWVDLVVGHCYVVWTHDDHFAKFRVTEVSDGRVVIDWAYQVDRGNPELAARPAEVRRVRRPGVPA